MTTYNFTDVFREFSPKTGHNYMRISVIAISSDPEYTASDPVTAPEGGWPIIVHKRLTINGDTSTGIVSWDAYNYPETKNYYYWITQSSPDGAQVVDGYFSSTKTSLNFEAYAEAGGWANGNYFVHVVAMTGQTSAGGVRLTEDRFYQYEYVKKIRTISIEGVPTPIEGENAEVWAGELTAVEDHVYVPSEGGAYWRRQIGTSWETVLPATPFDAAGTYRVSIPVYCEEGFVFGANPTVKINGQTIAAPELTSIGTDGRGLRVECELAVAARDTNVYVVRAGSLNVRAAASTDSERVGGLSYGDVVVPIATVGGWTMFKYEGKNAWVASQYLALTHSAGTAFADGPVYYTVEAGAIRVRDAASTSASSPTEMTAGKKVLATGSITNSEGTWIVIDYESGGVHKLGYMLFSYEGSLGSTVYLFNGKATPPVNAPAEEETSATTLSLSIGAYPAVSAAPLKAAVATGNTVALSDQNFQNGGDGFLYTTIYPDDAMSFEGLTSDGITLPEALSEMRVYSLELNSDGGISLKLGPKDPVAYGFSAGEAGSWTRGSSAGYDFVVSRPANDELTYSLFEAIEIDGVVVAPEHYTVSEGSLKGTLKPSFLNGLSVGEHTLTVVFQDGSAQTTLTIQQAAATTGSNGRRTATALPDTGDVPPSPASLAVLLIASLALIAASRLKSA